MCIRTTIALLAIARAKQNKRRERSHQGSRASAWLATMTSSSDSGRQRAPRTPGRTARLRDSGLGTEDTSRSRTILVVTLGYSGSRAFAAGWWPLTGRLPGSAMPGLQGGNLESRKAAGASRSLRRGASRGSIGLAALRDSGADHMAILRCSPEDRASTPLPPKRRGIPCSGSCCPLLSPTPSRSLGGGVRWASAFLSPFRGMQGLRPAQFSP